MKSMWKLVSSSFDGQGENREMMAIREEEDSWLLGGTAMTCWARLDHKGLAGNPYLFRAAWKACDPIPKGAGGRLQIPRDLSCPAHPRACPGSSHSTFSKSMGYILNPGSFSGLGSVALSSSRRLSSAGREKTPQLLRSQARVRDETTSPGWSKRGSHR